ncbi:MAG: formate dehydrogenase subunit gamma [Rhodobacteraceae bacterium]|nr:formate dehydrogenase subunit gamma [Paracoccaceae bacterium]
MTLLRRAVLLLVLAICAGSVAAQDADLPPLSHDTEQAPVHPRQTLDDILKRQDGIADPRQPRDFTTEAERALPAHTQLGTLGGVSDAEVWDALRFGTAEVKVSAGGPQARVVIQNGGMDWLKLRRGPLATYGGWLLLGTIAVLALFFLVRGRIRISHGWSGIRILRFTAVERFFHWLTAGSFVLLALTGLFTLFGRKTIGLLSGTGDPQTYDSARAAYAAMAHYSKWIHNNVSWAFMLGLVFVFILWVAHNIPNRLDLVWFAKGGGIIGNGHPPARKFNAGQKIVFWSVILLGASISVSGLSLLFPFEMPLFAATFAKLNALGVPGWFGLAPFPDQLAAQEEMQYAQLWHAIVAFVLMAIILAHIYIGSIGMEGAFDAMGDGEVDLNWAREHHSLWVEEVEMEDPGFRRARASPAE